MTSADLTAEDSPPPVLAEVVRSDFVEARHRGSVVTLEADGSVRHVLGEVKGPIYARSANKPMQAVGMLRCGLELPPELLALVIASHSGERFHVDGVGDILRRFGLDERALRCPSSWPIAERARQEMERAEKGPDKIHMNCSGKHAGMLATCVIRGWPVAEYLHGSHPLQVELKRAIEDLTGDRIEAVGTDGCGAPLFAVSLLGLARAFRRLALAERGTAEHAVATAIRAHPYRVSGTERDEAGLILGVPGLIAKSGAEAAYAVALPDGRAVACKIEDGGQRARAVVMAAALRALGVDAPVVEAQSTAPVHGGGEIVGAVRPAPALRHLS